MNRDIAVIITNKVQKNVEFQLTKKGLNCIGIEAVDGKNIKEIIGECKKIILPFPSTHSNSAFLSEGKAVSDYLTPQQTVVGGMISDDLKTELKNAGIKHYDYFENEAYVLKNAYLTSQGALRLLLENTGEFLVGKRVLITGFGRIGKSLAVMLKSLGMKVFVAVRSEEAATKALASGLEVFSFKALSGIMFYYDFIFNTVPSPIFGYKDISHINERAVYFELASSPFGAEKKDFELLGKKYVHGGALPGKYYPDAVARNIVDFILHNGGDMYE